ncbi:MAG: restriction endonuclease subunit S, partial [Proteobacteria bacterium]|nr:restriction endonuclease subunit S [Pseudomonadota bacterium]
MKRVLPFAELVEINPRVTLEKGTKYPFVEMGVVESSRRYVHVARVRHFKSGGAKFLAGDTLFARITPCLENGKIAQFQAFKGTAAFGSTEFFVFRARS